MGRADSLSQAVRFDLKASIFSLYLRMRLSYSLHDIRHPWSGNTNMINGFYQEPENNIELRFLDAK